MSYEIKSYQPKKIERSSSLEDERIYHGYVDAVDGGEEIICRGSGGSGCGSEAVEEDRGFGHSSSKEGCANGLRDVQYLQEHNSGSDDHMSPQRKMQLLISRNYHPSIVSSIPKLQVHPQAPRARRQVQ